MNMMNKLEAKIMPIALKISQNRELTAVREAMYVMMPFLIIGSFFLLFASFPVAGYRELVAQYLGNDWHLYLTKITDSTFGIMTIFVVIGTSYFYAIDTEETGLLAAFTTFMFFLIITPFAEGTIPFEWIGAKGMLLGIISALIITKIYITLYKKELFPKMPDSVPTGVTKSFNSLIPITIIAIMAIIINVIISLTAFASLHDVVYTLLSIPLLKVGNTLPGIVFSEMIASILWTFGVHGNDIVLSIMRPIWLQLSAENLQMVQNGLEPLNIITQQFKDAYLQIGGSGSTLPLLLVILLTSKSKHMKMVASLALIPGLFNINEPVIFGLPIVLNPILAIPFIIVPAVYATISYLAMSFGLVTLTNGLVIPWTTPVGLSGLLVSGPSGALLQIVLVIVGMLIYYPFVKMIDKQLRAQE